MYTSNICKSDTQLAFISSIDKLSSLLRLYVEFHSEVQYNVNTQGRHILTGFVKNGFTGLILYYF